MSITPQADGPLEDLLIFLKDYLNEQAAEFYSSISEPVQSAVVGLKSVQSDLSSVLEFPLLMGYRRQFSGEYFEVCEARIDYFLLVNVATRLGQSAMFTWVAKHLALALDDYNAMDEGCLKVVGVGTASILYAQVQGKAGPITIPFLRIDFKFEDYDAPA